MLCYGQLLLCYVIIVALCCGTFYVCYFYFYIIVFLLLYLITANRNFVWLCCSSDLMAQIFVLNVASRNIVPVNWQVSKTHFIHY